MFFNLARRSHSQETETVSVVPMATGGLAVAGFLTIFILLGGFTAWAALAPLAGGVLASGRITVDSNMKSIQHLEGGIIADLMVENGDTVVAGQTLIRLDPTRARAALASVQSTLDAETVVAARLVAERDDLEVLPIPETFIGRLNDPTISQMLGSQRSLLTARRETLAGQEEILNQRIRQLLEEQQGLEVQVHSMDRQLELISTELDGLHTLFEKGFTERSRILALKREAARLKGVKGTNLAAIAQSKKEVGETKLEIIQLRQANRQEVLAQFRDVQTRVYDLSERVQSARHVLEHIEIRAPNDGVIAEMAVHTVGGVIRPGDTVLKLVPTGDDLLVEARVLPVDIDNVSPGQPAQITLSAFSSRTTPTIRGVVSYVSADSVVEPQTGQSYFIARLSVPEEEVARLEGKPLLPGMPAEVMIATGERTPAEYLLQPLSDTLRRAWREQ